VCDGRVSVISAVSKVCNPNITLGESVIANEAITDSLD
jgi:hypothetical protein